MRGTYLHSVFRVRRGLSIQPIKCLKNENSIPDETEVLCDDRQNFAPAGMCGSTNKKVQPFSLWIAESSPNICPACAAFMITTDTALFRYLLSGQVLSGQSALPDSAS